MGMRAVVFGTAIGVAAGVVSLVSLAGTYRIDTTTAVEPAVADASAS